jgi:molybdopterin/thiamine biosynthesis adenylyltransferase/TusA-related sulfurtransferase
MAANDGAMRVAVIGAGGLGGPAAMTLARHGISVRLVDSDRVELSNLQRQVHFREADIGTPKVEATARRIREVYPHAAIEPIEGVLDESSAETLLGGCGVVIDATDNVRVRFQLNTWAVTRRVAAVIGGIQRFDGLVAVVGPGFGPCLACLFDPEEVAGAGTCAGTGVIGALAGVVGHVQGEAAARIVRGEGTALFGRALTVDAARGRMRAIDLPHAAPCEVCGGAMTMLDIRGARCPFTWVRTRLVLETMVPGGLLRIDMRRGETERNVTQNLRDEGHAVVAAGPGPDGDWRVFVRRGANGA